MPTVADGSAGVTVNPPVAAIVIRSGVDDLRVRIPGLNDSSDLEDVLNTGEVQVYRVGYKSIRSFKAIGGSFRWSPVAVEPATRT